MHKLIFCLHCCAGVLIFIIVYRYVHINNINRSEPAASVFGELWKLEPLPEERKSRWRREMDWLISPTNYMVELVPAKQNGANGCTLEVILSAFLFLPFAGMINIINF